MIKIDFHPTVVQLRQFGWIALFGFPAIGLVVLWRFAAWQMNWGIWTLFGLGLLCALLAATAPRGLKPIYVTMMAIALPIGLVVSAVLLRLIYYGLFTPMAIWFRIRGRDAMERRLDPAATTYWKDHRDRTKPRTPASYLRLY